MAFDKPSGLLVIPSPGKEAKTLTTLVNDQYTALEKWKLHPCHRLDKDTTGVILYAKGKKAQQQMMTLFHKRLVGKTYIALVHGELSERQGVFRKPVDGPRSRRSAKGQSGRSAETAYKVLKNKKDYSIVEVKPTTGRTNQIRIHFAQAGHPLLGERKFAFARDYKIKFNRTALHALVLDCIHPVTKKKITVRSELAKDIKNFITHN